MEKETLIMDKLNALNNEVAKIKEHIADLTLTNDDLASLDEADRDFEEGKTKRFD